MTPVARNGRLALAFAAFTLAGASPAWSQSGAFFESEGVPIHYEIVGVGSPVVFLHGFGGQFEQSRFPGVLDATRERQLIGMDVRGFGRSGKPTQPEDYGLAVVNDIVRLLDHLGFERADLIGFSMGGFIALKAAALHPDRIRSVVLASQGWTPLEWMQENAALARDAVKADPATLPEGWRALLEQRGHLVTGFIPTYPELYVTPNELQNLEVPVLVVVGGNDPYVERARSLQERNPAAEVVIVPDRGHEVIQYPSFIDAVAQFLNRNGAIG